MRAGIGILSLLVATAIILFAMFSGPHGGYVPTVIQSGQSGQEQANQLAGRDENGVPVSQTISLEENSPGGHLRSLTVKSILPKSPFVTAYGLVVGDEITEIGAMSVRDNDPELMKALLSDAYAKSETIVIQRAGEQFTINPYTALSTAHPNLFNTPGATVTGAPPSPAPGSGGQNIPTH